MKKRILTSAVAILIVGASAFSALTFTGCSCTGKGNKTQQTSAASAQQKHQTYETMDLLVCESWIGKLTSQVGMDNYVTEKDGGRQVEIKGKLFDADATGHASIVKSGDVISAVTITADALAYDTAKAELTKKYGEPVKDEGTSCVFHSTSNTMTLTQKGSDVTLDIK